MDDDTAIDGYFHHSYIVAILAGVGALAAILATLVLRKRAFFVAETCDGTNKACKCRKCGKKRNDRLRKKAAEYYRTDDFEDFATRGETKGEDSHEADAGNDGAYASDEDAAAKKRYRDWMRRRRTKAFSVSSFGGASTCSGCSQASSNSSESEVSVSVMREWLKSQHGGEGAMVEWMKREMREQRTFDEDVKDTGKLPPPLSRARAARLILKGKHLKKDLFCGEESLRSSIVASGYLWKRRRRRQRWRMDRFFSSKRNVEEEEENVDTNEPSKWQKRYFKLAGAKAHTSSAASYALQYFGSRSAGEDASHRPRGAIDLRQIESVALDPDSVTLHLHLAEGGVYLLRAESRKQSFLWYGILKERLTHVGSSSNETKPGDATGVEESRAAATKDETDASTSASSPSSSQADQVELVRKKHNLSTSQLAALNEILRRLGSKEASSSALSDGESTRFASVLACDNNPFDTLPFICHRFLRGRKFDVDAALSAMRLTAQWREEENIAELMHGRLDVRRILGCDPAVVFHRHPILVSGHDRDGRVCVYKYMGKKTEFKAVLKKCPLDSLMRFHIHTMEHTLHAMGLQSQKLGRNMEKMRVVVDVSGFYMSLFGSAAIKFLSGVARTDQKHYIERLESVFVINAPWTLTFAWRVVKTWLDDATQEKVKIMGPEKEWAPVLRKYIDESQIPFCFGGKARSLEIRAFDAALKAEPVC